MMGFQVKIMFIFLSLCLSAFASDSGIPCESLLLRQKVESAISVRVKDPSLDVPEMMRKEFLRTILQSTGHVEFMDRAKKILSVWRKLYPDSIDAFYLVLSIENKIRGLLRESLAQKTRFTVLTTKVDENAKYHYAQSQFMKEYSALCEEIYSEEIQKALKNNPVASSGPRIGLDNFERRLAERILKDLTQAKLQEASDFSLALISAEENRLGENRLLGEARWQIHSEQGKAYLEQFVAELYKSAAVVRSFEDLKNIYPSAEGILARLSPLSLSLLRSPDAFTLEQFRAGLPLHEVEIPAEKIQKTYELILGDLKKFKAKIHSDVDAKIQQIIDAPWTPVGQPVEQDEKGQWTMTLPMTKVKVVFRNDLGTMEMLPSSGAQLQPGPVALLWHGEGTIKSRGSSMEKSMSSFVAHGLNPRVISLPNAGQLGMSMKGMADINEYLKIYVDLINAEGLKYEGIPAPLEIWGRSMGSAKAYTLDLIYKLFPYSVDAYVLTSKSLPTTMALQTEAVYRQQREEGLVVLDESIRNADEYSGEQLAFLDELKKTNLEFLKGFGDHMIVLQGDADEDAGIDENGNNIGVKKLLEFRDSYSPKLHVYVFYDEDKDKSLKEVPRDQRKGTHFILNNNAYTEDQFFEVMAFVNSHRDYLLETGLASERLKTYSEKVLGGQNPWLNGYLHKMGLKPEHFAKADLKSSNQLERRAARVKRVLDYWIHEKNRVKNTRF